eukprot:gene10738-7643_t
MSHTLPRRVLRVLVARVVRRGLLFADGSFAMAVDLSDVAGSLPVTRAFELSPRRTIYLVFTLPA